MTLLEAVILGIVEGVTEFLPISSTGHLILISRLLGLIQTEFLKTFEIFIQLGAILAVLALYGRFLLRGAALKRILVAFLPSAISGLIFYKLIKSVLLGSNQIVLWSMFLGGVLLILFDLWHREDKNAIDDIAQIPYSIAIAVGLFQILSMIPGVSRAAATIIGGLIFGIKRKIIIEFSFLLAVPTMVAATILDLFQNVQTLLIGEMNLLLIGFSVSFIVAIFSIKFFLYFIKNHSFIPFGIYRIVAACLFWLLVKPL